MKIKILVFLLVQKLVIVTTLAQVTFSFKPKNLELIPRNLSNNKGVVNFNGFILNSQYSKLRIVTYQNKTIIEDSSKTYSFGSNSIPFSYSKSIDAGKYVYDFDLIFYGVDTLKYQVKNIVCGDVFIVQGQSNAVANTYNGLANTLYKDSFIRSYGTSSNAASACANDSNWYIADGDGAYNKGCIGQWGLVLAKNLLDSFKVPIAILNGAVGGTSVSQHQKNQSLPKDLNTIYGRLLYRMNKSKLENHVRAILFFQGESDGVYPIYHDTLFKKLYKDWRKDYKKVSRYYFVQVRAGCGSPTLEFLEIQRQFEFTLSNLKVISANGLNAHDGCHYGFNNGYKQLGNSLAPLLARDLYNSKIKSNIDPPNIQSANFLNENNNKILLTLTNPNDSIYIDNNFWNLFSLKGEPGMAITDGIKQANTIILTLNKSTCQPLYLSYLGKAGSQAWVKNRFGAGLISFNNILVNPTLNKYVYFVCPNIETIVGKDSMNGLNYYWKNLSTNQTYNSAKIKVKTTKDLNFEYSVKGFCKPDTNWVAISVDKTPKPNLGNDTTLCLSQIINYNFMNKYAEVSWINNNIMFNGFNYSVTNNSNLIVKVKSSNGCNLLDTVKVNYSNPNLWISAPSKICVNTQKKVTCNPNFKTYNWNNTNINSNEYTATHGTTYLKTIDSFGCLKNDSVIIETYPQINYVKPSPAFCKNDSAQIYLPQNMIKWQMAGTTLPTAYFFKETNSSVIVLTDANSCNYTDTLQPIVYPLPIFTLGKDTAICEKAKLKIICPLLANYYTWNGLSSTLNYVEISKGIVICQLESNQQCKFMDTIQVSQISSPILNFPSDTTICQNDSLVFESTNAIKYYLNNQFYNKAIIKLDGNCKLAIENNEGCRTEKNITLATIDCTSKIEKTNKSNDILIYPNPSNGIINVQFKTHQTGDIIIYNSLGQILYSENMDNQISKTIEIASNTKGIVYLTIKTNNNIFSKVLVLE